MFQTSSSTTWTQFPRDLRYLRGCLLAYRSPIKRETHCSYIVWALFPVDSYSDHKGVQMRLPTGIGTLQGAGALAPVRPIVPVHLCTWSYEFRWISHDLPFTILVDNPEFSLLVHEKASCHLILEILRKYPAETLGRFRLGAEVRDWLVSFLGLTNLPELAAI